jgi:c-di-GMP-binding flagellar brake protein YcgR
MEGSSQDKRIAPRVSLDVVLFLKADVPPEIQLKVGREIKTGRVVDISETGISFQTDVAIPRASHVGLIFDLIFDKGQKSRITTSGEVVYCAIGDSKGTHRIGITFKNLKESGKKAIADYVAFVFERLPRKDA